MHEILPAHLSVSVGACVIACVYIIERSGSRQIQRWLNYSTEEMGSEKESESSEHMSTDDSHKIPIKLYHLSRKEMFYHLLRNWIRRISWKQT